jgi:hypothetical protein
MTIDGTDFKILEPQPFSTEWWSHKYNGPGVRYEIGVSIELGWIVWVNGPYPCGPWTNLVIARHILPNALLPGEQYIADDTYRTAEALIPSDADTLDEYEFMAAAQARHEQVSRLFKFLKIVANPFKRKVNKHGFFMHAVANIAQLGLMTGEFRVYDVLERCPLLEGW